MLPRPLTGTLTLALAVSIALVVPASAATPARALPASADAFELHSKPGSNRTIFLDFDGAVVTGTVWNEREGMPTINAPAWTIDSDPATFDAAELAVIVGTWQRVAETFSPFDVDVTTEDPGVEAITRTGAGDPVFGTRVLITSDENLHDLLCHCPGIAQLGAFDEASEHARLQPAWVLGKGPGGDPDLISRTISHEVGHQFGLQHDGNAVDEYHIGHLSGPVMGLGSDGLTQWSNGDYPGANNQEDDVQLIAANGAPFRTDEIDGPLPSGTAYISSRTDTDTYTLPSCQGTTTVLARVAEAEPTLDIGLTLKNASDAVLDTDDPAAFLNEEDQMEGLNAIVSVDSRDALRVTVDGVGLPGEYSDYGSLGSYTLERVCGEQLSSPSSPTSFTAVLDGSGRSAVLRWAPPSDDGGRQITGYVVREGSDVLMRLPGDSRSATIPVRRGFAYHFSVAARNDVGEGPRADATVVTVSPPGSPPLRTALDGKPGRPVTATARWRAPLHDGDSPITGYLVTAGRLNSAGQVVSTKRSRRLPASTRVYAFPLAKGRYVFVVQAVNAAGPGAASARSNPVRAR